MKNSKNILLLVLSSLFLGACATTNSSNGSFYGYDNTPEREEYQEPEKPKKKWKNPLAEEDRYEEARQMEVNNYYYGNAGYVPVIAPWWDRYYGWGSPMRQGGVFITFGAYRSYEWFSPWYDFHPYYGCSWYDYYYVRPHYRAWYNQPVYAYSPYYRSSWNYFGTNRGFYSHSGYTNNPRSSHNNNRNYNPRSQNVDYRRTNANYGASNSRGRNDNYQNSRSNGGRRSQSSGSSYSGSSGSSSRSGSYSNSGNSGNSRSNGSSSRSSSNRRGGGSYNKGGNSSKSSGNSRSSGGSRSGGSSSNRRGGGGR